MDISKLNQLSIEIHENALNKGFWDNVNLAEKAMLVISELSECLEAHRKSKFADLNLFSKIVTQLNLDADGWNKNFEAYIKDSVEDELADAIIRCLDMLYYIEKPIENLKINKIIFKEDNFAQMLLKCCSQMSGIYDGQEADFMAYRINVSLTRIFTLSEILEIDIMKHVELKMAYNKTRERLHGKAY